VKDIVVVVTEDAALVTSKGHAEEVRGHCRTAEGQWQRPCAQAQPRLPTMGLVLNVELRRALPGEMHHGDAWRQTLAAKAPSPLRTLGGGEGPLEVSKGDEIELLGETQSTYIPIGKPHISPALARCRHSHRGAIRPLSLRD
jgi:hypothetical protein